MQAPRTSLAYPGRAPASQPSTGQAYTDRAYTDRASTSLAPTGMAPTGMAPTGHAPTSLGRRAAVLGLAGVCATAGPGALAAEGATLLVAGPAGGRLDRWAGLAAPWLARALPGGARLARRALGGVDGVTAANAFDALVEPDGSTALLVPGAAPLAWLAGDQRAQFDPRTWMPAWAALAPAVLLARAPLAPGRKLHIPAIGGAGPVLPMLLALDLLGIEAALLPRAAERSPADLDAVFLSGPGTAATAAALREAGLLPVLALGVPDAAGGWGADPAFPGLPTAVGQVAARQVPVALALALRAAAAAAQLDAALVLPALATPDMAAAWQRACAGLASSPDVLAAGAADGVRPGDPASANAAMAAIALGGPAAPELQRWLAARYA